MFGGEEDTDVAGAERERGGLLEGDLAEYEGAEREERRGRGEEGLASRGEIRAGVADLGIAMVEERMEGVGGSAEDFERVRVAEEGRGRVTLEHEFDLLRTRGVDGAR